ncbi:hypothetical protein B0A49_04123 [Cryomyces minteri]|uniref:NECAP PHear domain-containing protein n=1 Tax=Cryomyces minteri TaxID=331657 RepID=A0A4U0X470_9PEZI|nr:hypothetical protein B0A49_04123 [Cryomyces minteri]
MTSLDPSTSLPLPPDAIQRVLFVAPRVHVYHIPPLTLTKGHTAAHWTTNAHGAREIFTARLRILETALPSPTGGEAVTTAVLLEDGGSGELFAAAPYASPAAVEQAIDSSRFFAVRVVGEGGMKATLGIGFEERSEAVDFSISLQDVRKALGMEGHGGEKKGKKALEREREAEKKDFSLKEGETITVNIGGRGRRQKEDGASVRSDSDALFSIKPPPSGGGGGMPTLAPPPSASEVKAEKRRSREMSQQVSAQDLGFDDGEFGEFQ